MKSVDQAVSDIRSLTIQGATNVALAVLDTLTQTIKEQPDISCYELTKIGERLAYARPTEPLAQNAVRFVSTGRLSEAPNRIAQYKTFIEEGKRTIPTLGIDLLKDGGSYLTICHSSTTVALFKEARTQDAMFAMYVAETRPLYQGRITATELLQAGFDDVTMIVDTVAISLIEGRIGKIDAVFLGADLLSAKGFVNKVGSLAVAAAAKRKKIPVYVLSTLLKYDPAPFSPAMIEKRDPGEIWAEAPDTLRFYAPAFDYIPYFANVRVICEHGIIPGNQVRAAAARRYPFLFEKRYNKRVHYGKSVS